MQNMPINFRGIGFKLGFTPFDEHLMRSVGRAEQKNSDTIKAAQNEPMKASTGRCTTSFGPLL